MQWVLLTVSFWKKACFYPCVVAFVSLASMIPCLLLAGNFHRILLFMFLAGLFPLKRKVLLTLPNMTCLLVSWSAWGQITALTNHLVRHIPLRCRLSYLPPPSSVALDSLQSWERQTDTSGGQFTMSETWTTLHRNHRSLAHLVLTGNWTPCFSGTDGEELEILSLAPTQPL